METTEILQRRARVFIDATTIRDLIKLPEGVGIAGFRDHPVMNGFFMELVGESLPLVPDNEESPIVRLAINKQVFEVVLTQS